MRRLATTGLSAALLIAVAPALAGAATPSRTTAPAISASTSEGTYAGVTPTRLYDSRSALKRPLKPGEVVKVQVTGRAGVPSTGVSAAVINLTTANPTKSGYLAAYPSGSSGSGISTLLFAAGDTRATLATVPVGPDGSIYVRNAGGSTAGTAAAIVDVQGYYRSAAAATTANAADFFPTDPTRVLDTRRAADGPELGPGEIVYVDLSFDDPDTTADENADVDTLAFNLTAVSPSTKGYLVAYNGAENVDPPNTSNLNFTRGRTTPNNVIVPVTHGEDSSGSYVQVGIGNGSDGTVDVLADLVGLYAHGESDGLRFAPQTSPVRILDTRTKKGGLGTRGPQQSGTVTAPSSVAVSGTTAALVGSLTGVHATASTFLTTWETGTTRPGVSNLNPAAGQTVANHDIVGLSEGGQFNLYNQAGRIDVLFDVAGRFDVPTTDSTQAARSGTAMARQVEQIDSQFAVGSTSEHRGHLAR